MSTISVTAGRVFERLNSQKARRRGQRGVLTRKIKELRVSVDEDVREKLQDVEEAYAKICQTQGVIDQLVMDEEEHQEQVAYANGVLAEIKLARIEAAGKMKASADGQQHDQTPTEDMSDPEDNIQPEDSASQAGVSLTSYASLASVRAASLLAQADALQEKQDLELQELKIKQRKEALKLRVDIAKAEAEAAAEDRGSPRARGSPGARGSPSIHEEVVGKKAVTTLPKTVQNC
jgi:hypothetical protein